jgi:hypothetical protein
MIFMKNFGFLARNIITGFTGITYGYNKNIAGCEFYAVRPQSLEDNTKESDGRWVEVDYIEIVNQGIVEKLSDSKFNTPLDKPKFKLGQKLKDRVTGYIGIAVGYTIYASGDFQYAIKKQVHGNSKKLEDAEYFDESRLVLVDEGILEVEKEIKKKNKSRKKSGGPSNPMNPKA